MVPEFKKSHAFTIGVELEFQLVDRESLALVPLAPRILESLSDQWKDRIKKEFIQSMLEVNTGVCHTIDDVAQDLRVVTLHLEQKAHEQGALLHPTSLHPFSRALDQQPTQDPRYLEILEDLRLVGQMLITQGLHVHIGVPDGDTAIWIVDHIRAYLPLILSLTASSPFFQGIDTGFQSYRSKLFEQLPRSGIPASLGSWDEYVRLCNMLMEGGIISDVRDIWWDVRPHPYFGTIEVRIGDLPPTFKEILAITALIHALVVYISRNRNLPPPPHRLIIANNKWQAARYGLNGTFVDLDVKTRLTQREAVTHLLARLEDTFLELGSKKYTDVLKEVLTLGSGSYRQRTLKERGLTFQEIIKETIEGFWNP